MSKKEAVIFQVDDLKGVVMSWLNESGSNPEDYLTEKGMAFVNGYAQANNTVQLIKIEKYEELTNKYGELINKYEDLTIKYDKLIKFIDLKNRKRIKSNWWEFWK
jgi:hypothetical protein